VRIGTDGTERVKRWAWVLAIVIPLVAAAAWVGWYSSWLTVQEIRVSIIGEVSESTGQFPREEVDALAVVPDATPMLRAPTDEIAQRVSALPQVKEVSVRREWPHSLVIDIVRRSPVAAVRGPSGFDLIDLDGMVVVEVARQPDDLPFIVATGAGLPASLVVAAELPEWLREQTEVIEATTRNDVRLVLRDGSLVRWGNAERTDVKVRVLASLLPGGWAVYDVSAPEVPTTSDETSPLADRVSRGEPPSTEIPNTETPNIDIDSPP
jgi:cell division protein FtsQ